MDTRRRFTVVPIALGLWALLANSPAWAAEWNLPPIFYYQGGSQPRWHVLPQGGLTEFATSGLTGPNPEAGYLFATDDLELAKHYAKKVTRRHGLQGEGYVRLYRKNSAWTRAADHPLISAYDASSMIHRGAAVPDLIMDLNTGKLLLPVLQDPPATGIQAHTNPMEALGRGYGQAAEAAFAAKTSRPAVAVLPQQANRLNLQRFARWGRARVPFTPGPAGLMVGLSLGAFAVDAYRYGLDSAYVGAAMGVAIGSTAVVTGEVMSAAFGSSRALALASRASAVAGWFLSYVFIALTIADWKEDTNTIENLWIIADHWLHPELTAAPPGPSDFAAYVD